MSLIYQGVFSIVATGLWFVARIGVLVGAEGAQAADREELFTAWRRFLEAIAARTPFVLVVEDVHWADAALLAFLDHAERHYRLPDGTPTSEIYEVKIVVRALRELYGDKPVAEFGPCAPVRIET